MIVTWHTIWSCWTKLERLLTIMYHHIRALEILQWSSMPSNGSHSTICCSGPHHAVCICYRADDSHLKTRVPSQQSKHHAVCKCYRGDDSHLKIRVPSQQSEHHAVCICYRGDDSHLKNRVPSRQLLNPERGYYWLLLLTIPQGLVDIICWFWTVW
jgi:hypothetical protein